MYAVQAIVTRSDGRWTETASLPTFYLHENVQGILDEGHAERIAREIVDPFHVCDTVAVCAVRVEVSA